MSSTPTTPPMPADDAIQTRAYLLWEADGRPWGRDAHYWALALAELTVAAAPAAVASVAPPQQVDVARGKKKAKAPPKPVKAEKEPKRAKAKKPKT